MYYKTLLTAALCAKLLRSCPTLCATGGEFMKMHLFNSCHKIYEFWISKSLRANIYVYIYIFFLSIYIPNMYVDIHVCLHTHICRPRFKF